MLREVVFKMERIEKSCVNCRQNYSEKFVYCPNCSKVLTVGNQTNNNNFDYAVTLVENKKSQTSQLLMLGAFLFVSGLTVTSLVASIYNTKAFVASLEDDLNKIAFVYPDQETTLEPEPISEIPKKKGGGGNGGNDDLNPVSKGDLADQSENPLMSPSVSMSKVTNPDIPVQMQTKGIVKRSPTNQYGNPDSAFDVQSDGIGLNGGQGNGRDRGQGTGKGPGTGPGSGTDIGINGNGPGGRRPVVDKDDETEKPPPIPKNVSVVSVGLNIILKPKATYTDAARENGVQGTVILRVTFNANGSIGSVVALSGLPHGLTEQAIAAAKNIKFEPAKKNGVPQTISRQIAYSFILY